MKNFIFSLLILLISITVLTAQEETKDQDSTQQAIKAAESWLEEVDKGDYNKSWEEAAEYFKNVVTKENWQKSMAAFRKPLGKIKKREVISTQIRHSLPGAPDGNYIIIRFNTAFEHKKAAIETITPMLEKDGQWRVSGYYIK